MTTTWTDFTAARDDRLRRLAGPILAAVARHDTDHPAFHGCVDWHSAVHGTFALLAVSRLTGDPRYRREALTAVGGHEALNAEVQDLRRGWLAEELPYGLAWALQLDVEAARSGIRDFHEFGVAARDELVDHLPVAAGDVSSTTYANPLWAAYCLHRWATAFSDDAAASVAGAFAIAVLPHHVEVEVDDGFLSPDHLAVLLARQTGMPAATVRGPLAAVRRTEVLTASDITTPYRAGLNFSRAWGCHAAWLLTGDPAYRDLVAALIGAHLDQPTYWADHYLLFGHWIAQFGVFAIHLTEETT